MASGVPAVPGVAIASQRFGHDVHKRRLEDFTTPSERRRGTLTVPGEVTRSNEEGRDSKRRVLFLTSNGAGVGHLMRVMAMARRLPQHIEPVFMTLSQAANVVANEGYLVEYFPSRAYSGAELEPWHHALEERTSEIIARLGVCAIVFDGVRVYRGLLAATDRYPDVKLVWSRRAMWKRGVVHPALDDVSRRFDVILEPGELASELDRGMTTSRRSEAVQLAPVTYLGTEELLDREDARRQLSIDPSAIAALVTLGAGNINDTSSVLGRVVERLAAEPGIQVVVAQSAIAQREERLPSSVRALSLYPLARYLQAFDIAVAAAGYNSFHELTLAAVPTIWLPNLDTATDDQAGRARWAEQAGLGVSLEAPSTDAIDRAVTQLLSGNAYEGFRERALVWRGGNGADRAARTIAEVAQSATVPLPVEEASRAELHRTSASRLPAPSRSAVKPATNPSARAPSSSGVVRRSLGRVYHALPARVQRQMRRVLPESGISRRQKPEGRESAASSTAAAPQARQPRGLGPAEQSATSRFKPMLAVLPGNVLDGAQRDGSLIPVLILLPPKSKTDEIVDAVAGLQAVHRSFAPMFLTSDIQFRAFRRHAYLFEYFPGPQAWAGLGSPDDWALARAARIEQIVRWYQPRLVLPVPDPPPTDLLASEVATVLRAVGNAG